SENFTPLIASTASLDRQRETFDFILDSDGIEKFGTMVDRHLTQPRSYFVAHNAGFERGVLRHMGINIDKWVTDSAVHARAVGAGERLAVASRQLTDAPKLEEGADLIQLFCVPNRRNAFQAPTVQMIMDYTEQWIKFCMYCE